MWGVFALAILEVAPEVSVYPIILATRSDNPDLLANFIPTEDFLYHSTPDSNYGCYDVKKKGGRPKYR
jgi:hypothetical protein